jgi:hypothetical protein
MVALFLGWAVLDESIGATTLAGAAFIIGGVGGVMYGPRLTRLTKGLDKWRAVITRPGPVPALLAAVRIGRTEGMDSRYG